MRDRKGEGCTPAEGAFHPHAATEVLDDLPADVQAEAAAVRLGGERIARLAKLVEDQLIEKRARKFMLKI